jgi:citrate synthase
MQQEARHLSREEAPGRGGKVGGAAAASKAPSAAAIAKILSGADFPKDKQGLIKHAEKNKKKVKAAEQVIQLMRELPDRNYNNMADVEKGVAEVR